MANKDQVTREDDIYSALLSRGKKTEKYDTTLEPFSISF
jgi:hypothetical protein